MLSQNKIKLIKLLDKKKYRTKHKCFVVEGEKMVLELIESGKFNVLEIFTTDETLRNKYQDAEITNVNKTDLQRISFLKTANTSLALVELPECKISYNVDDFVLVLDNVQDPGNLGTIIRTASWFGVNKIVCSENTADIYNPKVVQSSMGAIFSTNVIYTNLIDYLARQKDKNIPIYGTHLNGKSIYQTELKHPAIIVMGNESKGISEDVSAMLLHKILIPSWQNNLYKTESLNVGTACAITLSEFRSKLSHLF